MALPYKERLSSTRQMPHLSICSSSHPLRQSAPVLPGSPQQFAEKLELIYQQNSGSAQLIAEDINNSDDLNTLSEEIPTNEDLLNEQSDAPVIRLINAVLSEAIKEHASDIHIEVFEKAMSIRFRVDGILRPVVQPNKNWRPYSSHVSKSWPNWILPKKAAAGWTHYLKNWSAKCGCPCVDAPVAAWRTCCSASVG
jgi:type II secretory ATPase GspE/PulE/Tfp pilus assembly ATPase PilB-like protein